MAHPISRRDFLRIGAAASATAVLTGCLPPRPWVILEPFVKPPEEQLAGIATWYASTCRQCPAGCGTIVRIMNGRALKIEGNPEHPLNRGKLCARGQAGLQLLYNPDRLRGPVQQAQRGSRQFQSIGWNGALNMLATKLAAAGSNIAIWADSTTSGHLADIFQKMTHAVGAPAPVFFDLYTAMNGYQVLQKTSATLFGSNELPVYDVGNADVIFSFGANFLQAALSQVRYGVEYGAFRGQPLGKRGYLIQLEPRMSITGAKADRWISIRLGSEGLIAQAIAFIIADQRIGPADWQSRARLVADNVDINAAATASGLTTDELVDLARNFASAAHPLAIPGSPLTGQNNATDAAIAVQALNLVAGTIGQPGGLALSAISPLESLVKPAPSPYSEVQNLIGQMSAGKVQVLLVHGVNPVFSMPDKAGFVEAIRNVPLVVSLGSIVDETALWADLVLPDHTYLETWGYDIVSPNFGTPVVSGQQPVVKPLYDTRSTADVLLTVAKAIPAAAKALPWSDEVAFLKEIISQLPPGAAGGSGSEVLWSRFLQHGGWWPSSAPAVAAQKPTLPLSLQVASPKFQGSETDYPFYLHIYLSDLVSDGRGASQPWLQGSPDPMTTIAWQSWVEMHPTTAQKLGVARAQLALDPQQGVQMTEIVKVTSPFGEIEAPVYVYPAIRPDTIAMPIGQGHTDAGRYARNRGNNAMRLIGDQSDATGSTLAWNSVRVKIERTGKKVPVAAFEFILGVTKGFTNQAFPGQ